MNIHMETELRWLKAVERERLFKNTYPWVLSEEYQPLERPNVKNHSFNTEHTQTLLNINSKSNSLLDKTVETDLTQKFDVPTQTFQEIDQKSPTFQNFSNVFQEKSPDFKSSLQSSVKGSNLFFSKSNPKHSNYHLSERSSLKQSALSMHSFPNSIISKSSLRGKSEVMQAVYDLLDNLESSAESVEDVMKKYSGRARKVCEVVLEHISKEVNNEADPLGKVVDLSRIQEVQSESSLESKGITAMIGDVLKEILEVKQNVKNMSHSSN